MDPKIIELKINNELGLHARPASIFVRVASGFKSDIIVEKDGEAVNGKSLIGLLMLAAGYGSSIKITAKGEDSHKAIETLEELVSANPDFIEG